MKYLITLLFALGLSACAGIGDFLDNSGNRDDLGPNDAASSGDDSEGGQGDQGGDDAARAPVIVE